MVVRQNDSVTSVKNLDNNIKSEQLTRPFKVLVLIVLRNRVAVSLFLNFCTVHCNGDYEKVRIGNFSGFD